MKKFYFLALSGLTMFASCDKAVEDDLEQSIQNEDLVQISFDMQGDEVDAATRADHNFVYYIVVSDCAPTQNVVSQGYVGMFTDLSDATIALENNKEYYFYLSAFEDLGANLNSYLSYLGFDFKSFKENTEIAVDYNLGEDLMMDRYYGSTSKIITTQDNTVSIFANRFSYQLNFEIYPPADGYIQVDCASPAFNYTINAGDSPIIESQIYALSGSNLICGINIDLFVTYNTSNYKEVSKTINVKRNNAKTITINKGSTTPSDSFNGHAYVDLGLTTDEGKTLYWATCNVGADKPEDYGLYFAWGETEGYTKDTSDGHLFKWVNYKYCDGTQNTMTKYCTNARYGQVDNKTVLELLDDAAHVNWGGQWRMPTNEEMGKLCKNCTWTWNDEKKGFKIVGTNGNSIFIPAAGYRGGTNKIGDEGEFGYYWTSSLSSGESNEMAFELYCFRPCGYQNSSISRRYTGEPVRAVCVIDE